MAVWHSVELEQKPLGLGFFFSVRMCCAFFLFLVFWIVPQYTFAVASVYQENHHTAKKVWVFKTSPPLLTLAFSKNYLKTGSNNQLPCLVPENTLRTTHHNTSKGHTVSVILQLNIPTSANRIKVSFICQ